MGVVVRRAARTAAGLALGTGTAVTGLAPVAAALVAPGSPSTQRALARAVAVERWRVATLLDGAPPGPPVPPDRALHYLAARAPLGLLGGGVLALLALGVAFAATVLGSWLTATPWLLDPGATVTGGVVAAYALPGVVLLYLALAGAAGVAQLDRALLRRLDAPTPDELHRRVADVVASRDAVVAAVDDERRRIERDLHDGVQQRLVALGVLIGRARRHPGRADLLEQAHVQAQQALVDLREVAWRVHPAALETAGLAAALESVAERAPLPVALTVDLPAEPPVPARAVAWFVACEAVTNAAKHADAREVRLDVRFDPPGALRVTVTDDGRGGAVPTGGGLSGLARRVAAADGAFTVVSPPGGPTVVAAVLPCG